MQQCSYLASRGAHGRHPRSARRSLFARRGRTADRRPPCYTGALYTFEWASFAAAIARHNNSINNARRSRRSDAEFHGTLVNLASRCIVRAPARRRDGGTQQKRDTFNNTRYLNTSHYIVLHQSKLHQYNHKVCTTVNLLHIKTFIIVKLVAKFTLT